MRNGGSYDEERSWVGCGRVGGAGEERNMDHETAEYSCTILTAEKE